MLRNQFKISGISHFQVDINRNGLPDGCRAVVNLAGENILNPFKRYSRSNMHTCNAFEDSFLWLAYVFRVH